MRLKKEDVWGYPSQPIADGITEIKLVNGDLGVCLSWKDYGGGDFQYLFKSSNSGKEYLIREEYVLQDRGMLTARYKEKCSVFGDVIPYKGATFVCKVEDEDEVIEWIDYVYGGNSVKRRRKLYGGKIALRAEYQCW